MVELAQSHRKWVCLDLDTGICCCKIHVIIQYTTEILCPRIEATEREMKSVSLSFAIKI